MFRAALSLLLATAANAGAMDDMVSMMQRPMFSESPHPAERDDKNRRKRKEMQKHLDEVEKDRHLHEKQVAEEEDRLAKVEEHKQKAINEKQRRQTEYKAGLREHQAELRKADNDMKQNDYSERNARREAHTVQRLKDEEAHRKGQDAMKAQMHLHAETQAKEEEALLR
mmetsp:Transcript_92283/g.270114  ORF Transcript_92283/g.270114 Transcript_92283/m.270114 type:complete len:169 (+) Transcript_92283:74-580(+)